jgi:hypothetical protein
MPFEDIIQKFCRCRALSGRIFNFGKVQGTAIYFPLQASSSLIQSAVCEGVTRQSLASNCTAESVPSKNEKKQKNIRASDQ